MMSAVATVNDSDCKRSASDCRGLLTVHRSSTVATVEEVDVTTSAFATVLLSPSVTASGTVAWIG